MRQSTFRAHPCHEESGFDFPQNLEITDSNLQARPCFSQSNALKDNDTIDNHRNRMLMCIAGYLRAKGFSDAALTKILTTVNQTSITPPLRPDEVTSAIINLGGYESGRSWESPLPLPRDDSRVLPLEEHHLPSALAPWLTDLAERMQVPLEFVASPALISAATLIGRKIGICPLQNDDWTVVPNLWGFLIAEPGSLKSPAIAAAMKPFELIEAKGRKAYQKECIDLQKRDKGLRTELEALKQAMKMDLKADFMDALAEKQAHIERIEYELIEQEHPKEKRYKTNDPTVEKLALILKDNPQGVLLLRDELSGWLSSLSRPGREGNREFYLETWNGSSSFTVDRIGRGSVHVEALCLSIFGGIQPAKLQEYINANSSAAGDDGFLERFQIVFYPERKVGFDLIDRKPSQSAFTEAMDVMSFLDALPFGQPLRLSPPAQVLANAWRERLESRLIQGYLSPIMRSYLGKQRSLLPRLALIFCLIGHAARRSIPHEVDKTFIEHAIRWCEILESDTRKVYSQSIHNPYFSASAMATKIRELAVVDGDSLRDIARKHWKGLNTPDKVKEAIDVLKKLKWVTSQSIGTKAGHLRLLE